MNAKRVLSGIQTSGSGELHIGNYLGAVKQWIELQEEHDAFYMLANLHAITVPLEPSVAKENVYKITALLLALGLDPKKATLFVQSLIPAHSELAWLLNTIAYMGELRRMTQFKDKAGEDQESVSVGLFDYPVLQAADILLYQANLVPVGEDQKQHLELTRNLAERFNNRFGQTFTLPDVYTPNQVARIMSLQDPTKKMSKSHGSETYIALLDDAKAVEAKIKRAVTDSDHQVRFDQNDKSAISNLLIIFSAVTDRSIQDLETDYGATGYGRFKKDLTDALNTFLEPIRDQYYVLMADRAELDQILKEGSQKAEKVAIATLQRAKSRMGMF